MRGPYRSRVKGSETANAIAEIIKKSDKHPKNLQTDMRKEFYDADVQRLVKKHGINHYSTYLVLNALVVEQLHAEERHVKDVYAQRQLQVVRPVMAFRVELQRSKASIGFRPVGVIPITEKLLAMVYNYVKIASPGQFKVYNSVRVSKYKTIFEKVVTRQIGPPRYLRSLNIYSVPIP